jgi:hypothetical protein
MGTLKLAAPLVHSDKNKLMLAPGVTLTLPHFTFITHNLITIRHTHIFFYLQPCCPWSHGLWRKKFQTSVAVPPTPVRVPRQRPLAQSVASVMSVANDRDDNEMIVEAVHRSGICRTAEENPRKPQLGDRLMKGQCDQSSPQMGSLSSK